MPESFVISIWLLCPFFGGEILFLVHICREKDISYGKCIYQGGEDIVLIRKLCSICFLVGFTMLWVMLCCFHRIMFVVGLAYILMLLCLIECMFEWLFTLLCNHCSHFYMTVLVYDQVAHMFHIMFNWSQFTCYIILVLLLLVLP